MYREKRVNDIISRLTGMSENEYKNSESLMEAKKLEEQMARMIYSEEHIREMHVTILDVLEYIKRKNEECRNIIDSYCERLNEQCYSLHNFISKKTVGNIGEEKVRNQLEILDDEYVILNNVELHDEIFDGEIDVIVISAKAIFLVEVKNPSNDIIIDTKGNYFKAKGCMTFNNIAEKMNNKESLLKRILKHNFNDEKKINLEKIVVFANSSIHVDCRYQYFKKCFSAQLPHIIEEYEGEDIYSAEDIIEITELILESHEEWKYHVDIEVASLKHDFAMALALLEEESGKEIARIESGEEVNIEDDDAICRHFVPLEALKWERRIKILSSVSGGILVGYEVFRNRKEIVKAVNSVAKMCYRSI